MYYNDLTDRQEVFVREYLTTFNGTKAAIAAGYSEATASVKACELLQLEKIQEAIKEEFNARLNKLDVTTDRIVHELSKIAFSDLKDYVTFNEEGVKFKNSNEVDGAVLQEVKETNTAHGSNKSIKLYDKMKALELLGRFKGMFVDTNKIILPDEYQMVKHLLDKYEGMSDEELEQKLR